MHCSWVRMCVMCVFFGEVWRRWTLRGSVLNSENTTSWYCSVRQYFVITLNMLQISLLWISAWNHKRYIYEIIMNAYWTVFLWKSDGHQIIGLLYLKDFVRSNVVFWSSFQIHIFFFFFLEEKHLWGYDIAMKILNYLNIFK